MPPRLTGVTHAPAPTSTPRRTPSTTRHNAADAAIAPDVNADTYEHLKSLSGDSNVSYIVDVAILIEEYVIDLAQKARKADRIRRRLSDPEHADAPGRDEARRALDDLEHDIACDVHAMIRDEARCDRLWQGMGDRATAAYWWRTLEDAPRLIGRTWYGIAAALDLDWPVGYKLPRDALSGLEWPLIHDVRRAGIFQWSPNPRVDPWPDSAPLPLDLQRGILDEKGNPK